MYVRTSLVLASLLPLVTSYLHYQKKIPNGHLIPFSCKPGKIWPAVGHLNDEGTGTRNCFGRDFEENDFVWNKTLCQRDSDGDGLYNGQEMGDPNCVWVEGATPEMSDGLSHPGICDPPNDEKCANRPIISPRYETQAEWMADVCKADGFQCDALNDKDIINVTARLPPATPVPAQMTHYICQTFNIYKLGIPKGRDFHIVAVTPNIDNKDVVHHMIVFGCTGYVKENDEPFACQVNPHPSCLEFLYLWTVGMDGECMYPETGTRLGAGGYETFIMQYHWSNIEARTDYTDSSGLTFHITPNMKRYDAGVFMVGSTFFELPAKEKYITITSTCASGCTKTLLNGSIIITAAGNHMHLLGKDMIVEIQRKGHHVAYITYDRIFVYDTPQVHHYQKPLELYPGDTIVTKCGFNTMSRDDVTSFGDGTYDEMCFGFITYHPKQYVLRPSCIDIMGFGMCEDNSFEGCTSLREFLSKIGHTRVFKEVSQVCKQPNSCEQRCLNIILKHMRIEPCMRGNIWRYIQNELAKARGQGYEFLSRIVPCKAEAEKTITADPFKN